MVPFSVQLCVQMVNIYKVYWPMLVHTGVCIFTYLLHQNMYTHGRSRHRKLSHCCRLQHTCTGTCRDTAAQAVARSKLSANAANCANAGSNCCLRLCLARAAAPILSAVQPRQRGTSAVPGRIMFSGRLEILAATKVLPSNKAVHANSHRDVSCKYQAT